jgi:hypothetical protein
LKSAATTADTDFSRGVVAAVEALQYYQLGMVMCTSALSPHCFIIIIMLPIKP